MSRFQLSPDTTHDLDGLIEHVNTLPEVAGIRLGKAIQDTIYLLAEQPGAGHVQSEYSLLTGEDIRSFVQASYIFLYAAARSPIVFLGILHGRRDVNAIMRQRLS